MKRGTLSIATGLLMLTAALLLTAHNVLDDRRAGSEAQDVLEQLLPEIAEYAAPETGRMRYVRTERTEDPEPVLLREDDIEYPDYVLNPNMAMPAEKIEGKDYIGVISIPSIGRELPVLGEWSYPNLKVAPCRYMGSAYLNTMILCAHNYERHFGLLKDLSYGDSVVFTDIDGNEFRYTVSEIEALPSTAVEEMMAGEWDLTLFTCTVGGAKRVTVRCSRA